MGLVDTLKQPAGPLPVGSWIAVVGGGLLISQRARKTRAAAAAATPSETTSAIPGSIYGGSFPAPSSDSSLPGALKYNTNEEWGRAAISALIGHGYAPDVATNAVNAFLYPTSAHTPSTQEAAAISAAIIYVGSPPTLPATYIPSATSTPVPTSTSTTPLFGSGSLALPAGRYQLERQALPDPAGAPQLYTSIGGQLVPTGYTSVGATPLPAGFRWFLAKVGDAASTILTYVDPRTGNVVTTGA